ncbi:MAG TPA: alpha/beta hydrolase [bacterium]|nr:alpha/beta hydrolase [bacterium]
MKPMPAKTGRRGRPLAVRILNTILLIVILALALILALGAKAKADLRAAYPPPGQLVDIGGRRLHIHCVGSGAPAVIMEAGAGDMSLIWALVQPDIGQFTTACVYDRAGHGWSDPGPAPTAAGITGDLRALLTRAGVAPPYVMVAHSLGGPIVRLYRTESPAEVAGIVLVDSSHEAQFDRFPPAYRDAQRDMIGQLQSQLRLAAVLARTGVLALRPSIFPANPRLPPDARAAYQALGVRDATYLEAILADQLAAEQILRGVAAAGIRSLGNIPLVVLAHGRADAPPAQVEIAPALVEEAEREWQEMQAELARLSPQGRLVIAEQSGHYVQLEQPELVIEAIRRVVEEARP